MTLRFANSGPEFRDRVGVKREFHYGTSASISLGACAREMPWGTTGQNVLPAAQHFGQLFPLDLRGNFGHQTLHDLLYQHRLISGR